MPEGGVSRCLTSCLYIFSWSCLLEILPVMETGTKGAPIPNDAKDVQF